MLAIKDARQQESAEPPKLTLRLYGENSWLKPYTALAGWHDVNG